uniref:CARD domain-containing protein n=1 Tax=Plectus sambesii TaxID=2011161 RepID=A0A914VSX0_9BILA
MEPSEVALLTKNRPALVRGMETEAMVDELAAAGVLLRHHENQIASKQTADAKNRELLQIIVTIKPSAFQQFVAALKATGQDRLLELLQGQSIPTHGSTSTQASHPQLSPGETSDSALLHKFEKLNEVQFKDLLRKNLYPLITKELDNGQILSYLHAQGVIDSFNLESIKAGTTSHDKNHLLYTFLTKRPMPDLLLFISGLQATNQKHIAETLGKDL